MRDTVRCPSCKAILVVPPVLPEGDVSCPRCLAAVPLPRTETVSAPGAIQAEPSAPPPPVPTPPAGAARPALSRCPHCGKDVQPVWRFCPHCEEPLGGAQRPGLRGTVDQDVRRDSSGSSVLIGLLAVLGGLGVFWYFAMALSQRDPSAAIGGSLILLLAALVSTGIMFIRTRNEPARRGVGQVVVGTLGLIGIVIAGGCAFLVFLFVACLAGGFRLH